EAEYPDPRLNIPNDLGSVLLVGTLLVLMLRQVLRRGPTTSRRVQGAVALYLLFGVAWGILYDLLEVLQPGSFRFSVGAGRIALPQLSYFSFTTLTTLGLGDILPINPLARSLVIMEALVGQLFPVILIARLVTMEITYRERRQNAEREP
ncbi:MAG TPA: potassium channel family protein, partial [Candidatus Binataceae bacterium]